MPPSRSVFCSWHQARGTQGPWCPSGRSCLNVPVAWRSRRLTASPSFPKNPFEEHGVCAIAGTRLYQLLNLTGRICSSFSWIIRQEVLLGWLPLLRKPRHLLHLGNGEAAAWSPAAAGEPCPSAATWHHPHLPIHTGTEHGLHDAPVVVQGRKSITCLS